MIIINGPVHEHDCEAPCCNYLCTVDMREDIEASESSLGFGHLYDWEEKHPEYGKNGQIDIYVRHDELGKSRYVARTASEGSEYSSGIISGPRENSTYWVNSIWQAFVAFGLMEIVPDEFYKTLGKWTPKAVEMSGMV